MTRLALPPRKLPAASADTGTPPAHTGQVTGESPPPISQPTLQTSLQPELPDRRRHVHTTSSQSSLLFAFPPSPASESLSLFPPVRSLFSDLRAASKAAKQASERDPSVSYRSKHPPSAPPLPLTSVTSSFANYPPLQNSRLKSRSNSQYKFSCTFQQTPLLRVKLFAQPINFNFPLKLSFIPKIAILFL